MKKIGRVIGIAVLGAAIVFSMVFCNTDPGGLPTYEEVEDLWKQYTQGDTYSPIRIPDIEWWGDVRELGANSAIWNVNVVTTVPKSNGSFGYELKDDDHYNTFDVLWINSMPTVPSGGSGKVMISDSSRSSTNAPGIVFMYDNSQDIRDNWYEAQYLRGVLEGMGIDPDAPNLDTLVIGKGYANGLADLGYPGGMPDQHDNYYPGILKVHEAVFQKYIAFVLGVHYNNGTSVEYLVMPQRGQYRNHGGENESTNKEGDSYIFFIAEAANDDSDIDGYDGTDKYITDVWLETYIETEAPIIPPDRPDPPDPPEPPSDGTDPNKDGPVIADDPEEYHPDPDEDPYGTAVIVTPPDEIPIGDDARRVVIISTATAGGAEVDPDNVWLFSGKPIKYFYEEMIKAKTPAEYNAMINIKNAADRRATWIWDRSDSWAYGISGCFTVITASNFVIGRDEEIVESSIPFYFACDNAAVVYINGQRAGYTEKAFRQASKYPGNLPGSTSEWRFTGLDNSDFTGDDMVWDTLYQIDIASFLRQGHNEILIMAANNDSSGGRWNDSNNPAALLFASEFTVRQK